MRIRKKSILLFLSVLFLSNLLKAQEKSKFGIEGYGWIGGMYFYDSRQTSNAREGLLSFYPLNIQRDALGKDINARVNSNLNLSSSRIGIKIFTPDVFSAKTFGVLEADFTGQSDANIHLFRLRQAHISFDWGKTKLLIGHTWSPLFLAEMIPTIQDLHNGGPFHPFSRTNQIRIDQKLILGFNLTFSAGVQRDYTSIGVNSLRSPMNQINSNIPELNLFLTYKSENLFAGFGLEHKSRKPRNDYSYNNDTYSQTTILNSMAYTAFANYKNSFIDIKLQGVIGQNLNDYMMLGGFVESSFDTINYSFTYKNTETASLWMDISYPKGKYRGALFIGYQKNLGFSPDFTAANYYGTGKDIDNVFRIAPRLEFYPSNNYFITLQAEYTQASYGIYQPKGGKVEDLNDIGNYRFSLAFVYKFNTPRL